MATKTKNLYVNKSPRVLYLGTPEGTTIQMVPGEPVELDADTVDSHEELLERGDIEEVKAKDVKPKKAGKPQAPNPNPSTGGDA